MERDSENFERGNASREGGYQRRPRIGSRPSGDASYRERGNGNRYSTGYSSNRDARGGEFGGRGNGYRSEGGYRGENRGGYRNENRGGYRNENQNREGGYQPRRQYNPNREEGFQERREGGFRSDSNRSAQGGYGRGSYGGYNRSNGQEGYNRGRQGGYNNQGGFRKNGKFGGSDNYDANAKYSHKKQIEYKKSYVDLTAPMRLNKFLSNSGICSRREADEYIQAGVVTVNGVVVNELGAKIIPATDKVLFHDQLVRTEKRVYILLNKPKDCVTTVDDPHAEKTVLDLVRNACSERVYPVGRLDRNTTGVLLITNDGDLTTKLTHPRYDKKKIYQVTVDHDITDEDFDKIANGLVLEDGDIKVDEISFIYEGDRRNVGVEIHSGKNRIVRRIFDSLGYRVVKLDRVYFAGLTKKNLPRGKWRYLSEMEVNMLKMSAAAFKD